MKKGRPAQSVIRQNIIEILAILGEGYGYKISSFYNQIFMPCTMRSIHYHLRKGLHTGEFKIKRVDKEEGVYSWGSHAEKTYYALGEKAKPKLNAKVSAFFAEEKL